MPVKSWWKEDRIEATLAAWGWESPEPLKLPPWKDLLTTPALLGTTFFLQQACRTWTLTENVMIYSINRKNHGSFKHIYLAHSTRFAAISRPTAKFFRQSTFLLPLVIPHITRFMSLRPWRRRQKASSIVYISGLISFLHSMDLISQFSWLSTSFYSLNWLIKHNVAREE